MPWTNVQCQDPVTGPQAQHPHSGATASTLHNSHTIHPESDTWRFLGSMPAIQRYKIHPERAIIHEVTGLNGVGCWWPSQNPMADSSTTTDPILHPITGECWARRQLRSGIKDVSVVSRLMKSLTLLGVVFIGPSRSQNPMADSSMTVGPILNLIAGGC